MNGDNSFSLKPEVNNFTPYDPTQEPIFPPELSIIHEKYSSMSIQFGKTMETQLKSSNQANNEMIWFRPSSLDELLKLKFKYRESAKIVVGNTELGVEMRAKRSLYPVMIQPTKVPELNTISCITIEDPLSGNKHQAVKVGAAVTLSAMEEYFTKLINQEPMKWRTRVFFEIVEMLRWFAGKQIRNVAAIGGNIVTGSPISDLNPIFMAAGCYLELAAANHVTCDGKIKGTNIVSVPFDAEFYTGYRRNRITPEQVLVSITIPCMQENEQFIAYKQARRRDDDIAIVNGAFFFKLEDDGRGGKTIRNARMAFGGMAATTKMADVTAKSITGDTWCPSTLQKAIDSLSQEMKLPPEAPGAMVRFRQTLAIGFLFKAFWTISERSGLYDLPSGYKSATEIFHKDPIQSHQLYEIHSPTTTQLNSKTEQNYDPVGKPIKHKAADQQATGEAVYVDDIPYVEGELYLGLVLSAKAHANILHIDASQALEMQGVVDFVCHKDLEEENNLYGVAIVRDESVFAVKKVECVGQIIGAIIAKDQATAQAACKKVVVKYHELPAILTIEDAIQANSFHKFRVRVGFRYRASFMSWR